MNLFYCEHINEPVSRLNETESKHCVRVLRMQTGDTIHLFDGKGKRATGTISLAHKKEVEVTVDSLEVKDKDKHSLHIAIAPTKSNDRIEWFLEKATELNVDEITLFQSQNSERTSINLDRYRRIILTAAKQSLSFYLPRLNGMVNFSDWIYNKELNKNRYIATLHQNMKNINELDLSNSDTLVMIGPEGGFTEQEVNKAIENKFRPLSLGSKRLRTETAGLLVAMSFYNK